MERRQGERYPNLPRRALGPAGGSAQTIVRLQDYHVPGDRLGLHLEEPLLETLADGHAPVAGGAERTSLLTALGALAAVSGMGC